MDVWGIFWIDVLQLEGQGAKACAGEAGIAFVHLHIRKRVDPDSLNFKILCRNMISSFLTQSRKQQSEVPVEAYQLSAFFCCFDQR